MSEEDFTEIIIFATNHYYKTPRMCWVILFIGNDFRAVETNFRWYRLTVDHEDKFHLRFEPKAYHIYSAGLLMPAEQ